MDFKLSDEQLAVSEAAAGIFSGLVDAERIAGVELGDDRIDRDLWHALADADLLGLAVPEADGGAGYGLMELCLLLEAQGNAVAPVPLWATLVLGALPIAHFGSEAQRGRWLPGVVAGDVLLTAALSGTAASPTSMPAVHATVAAIGIGIGMGAGGHRAGRAPGPPGGPHRRAGPDRGRGRAARARRSAGAGRHARARRDHQPRDPPAPASRGRGPWRRGTCSSARTWGTPPSTSCSWRPPSRCARCRSASARRRSRRPRPTSTRASSSGDRSAPSRAPCCGRPTPPSTSRRCGSRGRTRRGASTPAATPPTRPGWPSGRPPSAGSVRCTPPSTCTGAWGRTSPTRSTATSSGASRSNCSSVGPSAQLARLGADIAEAGAGPGRGGAEVSTT